jgi:ATP-dependent RNA helicase SUPV3L1/SUV3
MSGYRNAGSRAIRIDMLERLADMLRGEDSRGGFEAKADMLSISGTTLEQFADLMQGLGYKAEAGERPKVKAVSEVVPPATEAPAETSVTDEGAQPSEDAPLAEVSEAETPVGEAADAAVDAVEMEAFYTFTWARAPRRQQGGAGDRPKGKGKPNPRGKKGQRDGGKGDKSQNFSARPPKAEKKIDPDNPFAAALMGLKGDK